MLKSALKIMDLKHITDEEVEQKYLKIKNKQLQFQEMIQNQLLETKEAKKRNALEKQLNMSEEYMEWVEDAFQALRTENGRKHYLELENSIQEYVKVRKFQKEDTQSWEKIMKLVAKMDNDSNIDTKKVVEKMVEDAAQKVGKQTVKLPLKDEREVG